MYRSRLGKNLDQHTLDYVSSISDDSEIAIYDIIGSQAHSIMLYENKILNKTEVKKILAALEKLKKQNLSAKSSAEDIHELIETMVIKKTGLEAGGKMHTARSRNDQVALDLRMKIRDDINTICSCILDMVETLILLAE
ncbi:MAG: argininosuccinate lyase, partial [Nitrosopumilaceae archaeon]|nr:argininosuccinate lyase [Nitrosopumilaceae archaeon]